jgi:hypothetical protein
MTIHLPTSIYLQTQATTAAYEAEAKREQLLRQAGAPSTLRSGIAAFLHGLAERLAPDLTTRARHLALTLTSGEPNPHSG